MTTSEFVRRRPVTVVVAAVSVGVVICTAIYGWDFVTTPLPVPEWVAGWWFSVNLCLSVVTFACVWRNLYHFEEKWTWQELVFLRGVLLLVFGNMLGYLARAFNNPMISIGTPLVTAALLMMIYASLRPPERFEKESVNGR